jgi:ABC-type multidrug transport system fused ATPase/permease subunit
MFSISAALITLLVGRTGAGKSTIANALLRAIPIEGSVFYDDRQTSSINLSALRSNITIIPQHPELLNGTLRDNLDPFGEHDDAMLNSALHSAGLSRLQQEDGEEGNEGKITLETDVQAGGSNFSQGQRQILALARAMVRRSKLLILDEATAAIGESSLPLTFGYASYVLSDFETDQAIQQSLRTELHDVTLLTVAHRLKTIMDYDKIVSLRYVSPTYICSRPLVKMVLDAGSLIEFDTPKALLSKKSGLFYHLVEESSDRDELYRLAGL